MEEQLVLISLYYPSSLQLPLKWAVSDVQLRAGLDRAVPSLPRVIWKPRYPVLLTTFAQTQVSFLGKKEEDSEHTLYLVAAGISQGTKWPEGQNQNRNRQKGEGRQRREMREEVLTKGKTN